jgi:hypothetical protein
MSSEPSERASLEKDIIERSKQLKWDATLGCFDGAQIDAFIDAWGLLAGYYKWQGMEHPARESIDGTPMIQPGLDLSIGVEVIREYLYWTERFAVKSVQSENDSCAELRTEALEDLKGRMTDIIGAVERCIYPLGR